MRKTSVYLCGGMEFAGEFGRQWREISTRELESLGFNVFNPYTSEAHILEQYGFHTNEAFHKAKNNNFELYSKCMLDIVMYDSTKVIDTDIVLAWLDESCIGGSSGELTLARWFGKQIIGVLPSTSNKETIPGWCLSIPDKIFNTLEEALGYIKRNEEKAY